MTFNEFISKYLGKKVDFDNVYGGQCVDLFRQYVLEVLEFPQPAPVVGARVLWENYSLDKQLYTYYDRIPNTPFGVPQKGDVVIWNEKAGGGYGHVSMFIEGDVFSFKSFDQNWPTLDVCTITDHSYKNVYGWLRPKITKESCDALREALEKAQNHEKFWFDALKLLELPQDSKWKTYKATINGLLSRIEVLEKAVATNVTSLDAKKEDKYVYSMSDLFGEIIKRIRG